MPFFYWMPVQAHVMKRKREDNYCHIYKRHIYPYKQVNNDD